MKKALLAAVLAASAASTASAGPGGVAGSKHDLSVAGPGPIKSTTEARVCIFCHVSHGGGSMLSNRPDPAFGHQPYESSTIKGRPGAPTGASRLCLSCHDGTIAVGETRGGRIPMQGTGLDGRIPSSRRSNVGTDLRRTHPISVAPTSSRKTHRPFGRAVRLDRRGEIQCTSCHDPHSEFGGTPEGKFLAAGTASSQLCLACHEPSPGSAHASSGARFSAAEGNAAGYGSVGEAGCAACHQAHGGDVKGRLLSNRDLDAGDALCLRCHRGGAARVNIGADLDKPYSHAVNADRHDAAEGPDNAAHRLPESSGGAQRHASCSDCHDAHEANDSPASAPAAPGALAGAWGIDVAGRRVSPARFEYEICFKCHADSANMTPRGGIGRQVRRAYDEQNLRRAFGEGAASHHPVVAPGRNADVPSLRSPYTPASLVYCSDCHASDSGPGAGRRGARGPHGSIYPALLERNYSTGDLVPETPSAYALCYKCHERDTLLSDRSSFPLHASHVVRSQTPCSVCHVAHGVSGPGANATNGAHLIDFDQSVVHPGSAGVRRYEARGMRSGSCTLVCHGKKHDDASY